MKKQKIIVKLLFYTSMLALTISLALDILILKGKVSAWILVNDDYISSVFSGILTFSTLSLTVLSIIVSVLNTMNCGLTLKDILTFTASPIKFTRYIFFSMSLTFLSLISLIFGLCTFISSVAIITIAYTNYASIQAFKIISDDETCKNIVFSEIENKTKRISDKYITTWFNEYKNAINRNYKPDIDMYADILKKCCNCVSGEVLAGYLKDLFETACKNHSVSEAINLVFDSIGLSSYTKQICKESIQSTKYLSVYEIMKLNLPEAVESIISFDRLMHYDREDIAYCYFHAIIYSKILVDEKIKLLEEMINKITCITVDDCGTAKGNLIYRIVFYDVICEDNDVNESLYEMLLKSIYCNNLSGRNQTLMETMARIFRSAYFYSILGSKIFPKVKQDKIAKMVKKPIMLDWLTNVSIDTWVVLYRNDFLHFYIKDVFKTGDIPSEDTYSIEKSIKKGEHCILWYFDNKVKFALWYYFAYCSTSKSFPLCECSEEIENWPSFYSKTFSCLLNEFQESGSALTEDSRSQINAFGKLCSINTPFMFPDCVRKVYDNIKTFLEEHGTEV